MQNWILKDKKGADTQKPYFVNAKKMMSGPAKAFRYVMSHPSGKIEILGKLGDEMLFKYHQAKRVEDSSRFFTRKAVSDECWF